MSLKNKILELAHKITPTAASISVVLAFIGVVASIGTFSLKAADFFFNEATILGEISKYKHPYIIYYSGKLENVSDIHADKMNFKGVFRNGRVIDCKIQTMDKVENRDFGPKERAEFSLSRLSRKKKCLFDILVEPEGDVDETVDISWGKKGSLSIKPKYATEDAQRSFDMGVDLSSIERQRWLQNNVKNIKQHGKKIRKHKKIIRQHKKT